MQIRVKYEKQFIPIIYPAFLLKFLPSGEEALKGLGRGQSQCESSRQLLWKQGLEAGGPHDPQF